VSGAVLRVAVVGHTNTGKTSLLRTLTRDVNFGEVSDRPGTTRNVEGTVAMAGGRPVMELYDTPGLEDSIGLLEVLDRMTGRRAEGLEAIRKFLDGRDASGRFAQEAKALRQVLQSDIALYVVDARDRVLAKHRDELEILARCATPVVPVLNFTAAPDANVSLWRDHLSRVNMHAVAEFDTVVVDDVSEQRLYEKMRTLLHRHEDLLEALAEDRRRLRESLVRASADLVAELLIDVAAAVVPIAVEGDPEPTIESLRQAIRDREDLAVAQLLELHRFRPGDVEADGLLTVDGRFGLDVFSPQALREFGLRAGGAAAAGAAVGLMVDVASHGLTMGAGTVTGATIGGLLGGGGTLGRRLVRRAKGTTELRCDDTTLRLVALRQIALARALLRRGHAAVTPLRGPGAALANLLRKPQRLPVALEQARTRPQWSRLSPGAGAGAYEPARQSARESLSAIVASAIRRPAGDPVAFP
jgi:GTPase Era involved in 16S rRNA processing